MERNIHNSEFLDNYLKGKLSESEKLAFEEKVNFDPLLQNEVRLQKDIYNALSAERKVMLKNRLNDIPVNGNSWFSSYSVRWVAALSTLLITGVGTYYVTSDAQKSNLDASRKSIDVTADYQNQLEQAKQQLLPLPVAEEAEVNNTTHASEVSAMPLHESSSSSQSSSQQTVNQPIQQDAQEEQMSYKLPEVNRPELSTAFNDEHKDINYDDFKAPTEFNGEGNAIETALVDVETNGLSDYHFHYRYTHNKLYLYGDFDDTLYKVIALNKKSNKSLFLEYKGNYYGLDLGASEVRPLTIIEDSTVIKQLQKLGTK